MLINRLLLGSTIVLIIICAYLNFQNLHLRELTRQQVKEIVKLNFHGQRLYAQCVDMEKIIFKQQQKLKTI